jgi:hypothetical protein
LFKRNQVEEAVARVVTPAATRPSSELCIWLKRLLDTDRALGRNKRSADPGRANFAFYSSDMPGRGVEIAFSEYEAFALLTGVQLMRHGWPQGFVVSVLRRVRPALETEHARILRQDPAELFNQQLIRERARPGDLAVDNTDPVFLAIVSRDPERPSAPNPVAVCRGQRRLMEFLHSRQGVGWGLTVYEVVNPVHALSAALAATKPRKRGRAGR